MPNAPHILITDDDRQIRTSLARFLAGSGFRVSAAEDGAAMFAAMETGRFNLIVLDIMMPGEDGLSLCRRLRAASKIPVVLLTALTGETDRIVGLEIGADDYICKPFNPRELLARIRAVLRRTGDLADPGGYERPASYEFEGWRIDAVRRTLHNPEGALVELTAGEFDLLLAFAEHPQHVLTRDQLLDLTRGREIPGLRPEYRRAGQQAAAEDRSRPAGPGVHQDRAERRLRILRRCSGRIAWGT